MAAAASPPAAQKSASAKPGASSTRADSPLLTLEAITIDPAIPGPKTLCKLRVKIRNKGNQAATAFLFRVHINGQALPVYKNYVYLQTIAAGATGEIKLFNFWTTESTRPVPKDGNLKLDVTLQEARWVEVTRKDKETDYKLLGNVPNLPVSLSLTKTLGTTPGKG
jgi:hypothetical protein